MAKIQRPSLPNAKITSASNSGGHIKAPYQVSWWISLLFDSAIVPCIYSVCQLCLIVLIVYGSCIGSGR